MGDSFFTRCRYIRQYALLSCQSETPFLSARHRASSCCTTVEEPWFLDPHFLISLWTVFYQRYCDRGRKSARCFKLLQFDSGPFIFSFFFSRWFQSTMPVLTFAVNTGILTISGKLQICAWNDKNRYSRNQTWNLISRYRTTIVSTSKGYSKIRIKRSCCKNTFRRNQSFILI